MSSGSIRASESSERASGSSEGASESSERASGSPSTALVDDADEANEADELPPESPIKRNSDSDEGEEYDPDPDPEAADGRLPTLNNFKRTSIQFEDGLPSFVTKVDCLVDEVQPLLDQAEKRHLDVIPEWAKPEIETRFHIEVDGKLDEEPVGPIVRALSIEVAEGVMKQFSKLTLNQIHHYATLGAYINDLYRSQKLQDVIIQIDDQVFPATRQALCCHSELFTGIFFHSSVPAYATTEIELRGIDKELFSKFLHFIYFGEIVIDEDTVGPLHELSKTFKSDTLKAKIMLFVSQYINLNLKEAIHALGSMSQPAVRLAAIGTLIQQFDQLLKEPQYFKFISPEDMREIVRSNGLNIKTELDTFWGVLYWTVFHDKEQRLDYLDKLMSCVRFTCMSTLELLDCARATSTMRVSSVCKNLLINAHWIRQAQEMGIPDPLMMQVEAPRSHLVDAPPYVPTVQEFDNRYMVFLSVNHKPAPTLDQLLGMDGTTSQTEEEENKAKEEEEGGGGIFGFFRKKKKEEPKPPIKVEEDQSPTALDITPIEVEDTTTPVLTLSTEERQPPIRLPNEEIEAERDIEATHEFKDGKWRRKRARGKIGARPGGASRGPAGMVRPGGNPGPQPSAADTNQSKGDILKTWKKPIRQKDIKPEKERVKKDTKEKWDNIVRRSKDIELTDLEEEDETQNRNDRMEDVEEDETEAEKDSMQTFRVHAIKDSRFRDGKNKSQNKIDPKESGEREKIKKRLSDYSTPTDQAHGGNAGEPMEASVASLLDMPDLDMIRHLTPALRPSQVTRPLATPLRRSQSDGHPPHSTQ